MTFDTASASLRARRARRLGALVLAEQTKAGRAECRKARKLLAEGIAALGIARLPWSKAQLQLRNRVQFLRRAKARNGPICRTRRWRAAPPNGWRRF